MKEIYLHAKDTWRRAGALAMTSEFERVSRVESTTFWTIHHFRHTGIMSIHRRTGEMTGRGWYGGRAGHWHASDCSANFFCFAELFED
jgi:hypothetical protein